MIEGSLLYEFKDEAILSGSQLAKAEDSRKAVSLSASMEYYYDANGNLTKDFEQRN